MTDTEMTTMLLGLVLYRAGGEQAFTVDEIDDIKESVKGVRIGIDPVTGRIVVKTYNPEGV